MLVIFVILSQLDVFLLHYIVDCLCVLFHPCAKMCDVVHLSRGSK